MRETIGKYGENATVTKHGFESRPGSIAIGQEGLSKPNRLPPHAPGPYSRYRMAGERILDGLNDAQRQAVTHDAGPLLIVAGAGTGKTTVITRRIAWLIAQKKARPDEILALTFTD